MKKTIRSSASRVFVLALLLSLIPALGLAQSSGRVRKALMPKVVQHKGKAYYQTFRVTSRAGFDRIRQPTNVFRWFHGGGQYGDAFYLFQSVKAAKKFANCETTRGVARNVIAEVLLPKDKFDQVKKAEITKKLDWGMLKPNTDKARAELRDVRNSTHLVLGRWAESPFASEPFYKTMNGERQIGVVQRGQPSILNEAVIRLFDPASAAR